MYTFLTELQKRPDGIVNSTLTTRSSLATGLAFYYQRAAVAVTTKDYQWIALTLQDEEGNIIENKRFDTLYEPTPEHEEVVEE